MRRIQTARTPKRILETRAEREARYVAKDVTDKLGIKPGFAVRVVGKGDTDLLVRVRTKAGRAFVNSISSANIILYFPKQIAKITATLKELKTQIVANGGIWVITAKKNKGALYVPDQILIPAGLAAGLVDNKICSVSETQSAMRFVIRKAER